MMRVRRRLLLSLLLLSPLAAQAGDLYTSPGFSSRAGAGLSTFGGSRSGGHYWRDWRRFQDPSLARPGRSLLDRDFQQRHRRQGGRARGRDQGPLIPVEQLVFDRGLERDLLTDLPLASPPPVTPSPAPRRRRASSPAND